MSKPVLRARHFEGNLDDGSDDMVRMRRLADVMFAPGTWNPYADIEVDLTRLIFHRLVITLIFATTGLTGTLVVLAQYFHDAVLWRLCVAGFLVCCVRMGVALRFRAHRGSTMTPAMAVRWRIVYVAPTFVYCCLIAYVTRYTFVHYPIVGSRISMIGTFCIAAAMYARAGMRPWVMNCCGWLMLGNLAWLVWEKHGPMTLPAAALIIFFAYQNSASAQIQFHIVVEQLRSREKLRQLAEQDALTGLANRRHFQACFTALCSRAEPFGILSIDLDRFKKVNDTLGHAAGDELLIQVANRLGQTLRETDLLARLGGDEFAILQYPLESAEAGTSLAERINRTIGDVFHIEGQTVEIGASVGLRLFAPGDTDPSVILKKVDNALYRVKQAGGGSFCLAEG